MEKSIITGKFVKPSNSKKSDMQDKTISPEKFVAKIFECRDVIHLLHLSTTSYAGHKALDKMYTKMLHFADSSAEIIQGHMGILSITIPSTNSDHDPIKYITSFRETMIVAKDHCKLDEIKNIIDEMAELCSSTLYKLKHLK